MSDQAKIDDALYIASRYSQIDGAHHKAWAIDRMVRALTGVDYAEWVRRYKTNGEDPDAFKWDLGIAP